MTKPVGYGSPPDHTKFQKGQSGNPRGRKKGRKNFMTDLIEELSETVEITENGKRKTITKQRALQKSVVTRGIKGDVRAAQIASIWAASIRDNPQSDGLAPLDSQDLKILQAYLKQMSKPGEIGNE